MLPEITKAYTEPHRCYHTLDHIAYMFSAARGSQLTVEQIWAIWGHDLVFIPGAQDNEEQSAEQMLDLLVTYLGCDAGIDYAAVERMILDTKDETPRIEESKLIVDLDLLGFSDLASCEVAAKKLRLEFGHLSDEDWRKWRIKFLSQMAERDPFFHTEQFAGLGSIARSVIRTELACLKANIAFPPGHPTDDWR